MNIVELGDYIKQVRGVSYKSGDSIKEFKPGYLPVLRSNNIEESNINFDDLVYVPKKLIKEHQLLKKGDILITASTGSIKVIGKNGYIEEDYNGSFGAFCKVVRPLKSIESRYLKHYFQSKNYRRYIKNIVNGANINNIKNGHIDELKIPLPPLETQKKIAAILDEADKLRQLDKQLIEKYDALTQSLFLDMFGDPVTNTKGFNFPKLKDVCVVSQGMQIAIRHRKKNAGPNRFKYLTVAYLNGRKDEEYIENPRISVVCTKEDILMTRTGNTGQVVTDVEGVFHNNFFKVDWDRCRLNKTYFVAFLSHMKIKRELLKRASTTTIPDLNHGQFYDLNVIVPSIELQDQFAKRVEAIEAQRSLAQQSLEKSEELFNSLLQKAFKGELV